MARTLGSARHARLIELVIDAREAAGLTQAEVASRLGRHQPFVSNIESGERRVDLIELLDLAAIVGLDLHHVVEELTRVPPG
ncbi:MULTISPECIES: helix-turn-helix transcriptional regulator [unclassified Methylobacterium]|uniref:helix-turn-helix domain-containing protein n=1 Tax=unclassified Methylobacterium TaxID=2615210 RepID=UPI0011C1F41B|nr:MULTISPECIES: helix-turn-helix transcriptional regulator [unclassified Methylobacterium]QEE41644.1 helix-turn-helix transcriptional regulator [Methylobacterium sp. WL1]TXN53849.1 helix-turn-helix transcriptional regulator [Methylobacterium sp. WL2]